MNYCRYHYIVKKRMLMLYKIYLVTSEEVIPYKISRSICRRFQYYFLKVANCLKLCWYLQIHWIIQGFATKMLKTWLFWRCWQISFSRKNFHLSIYLLIILTTITNESFYISPYKLILLLLTLTSHNIKGTVRRILLKIFRW